VTKIVKADLAEPRTREQWLPVLGGEHFPGPPPVIVALDQNVTVIVAFAMPKLDVTPLQGGNLSLAETRADRGEYQPLVGKGKLGSGGLQQPLSFLRLE
jgi:hypothetical protein